MIMLNNNFLGGIIGLKLENNGYTFWEVRNRIIGKFLSIIASCLVGDLAMGSTVKGHSLSLHRSD